VCGTPSKEEKLQALLDLVSLFEELEWTVDAVVVEGSRDVKALRRLGYRGRVEVCSRVGTADVDLVEGLAKFAEVVVLTDFDKEGRRMNIRLTRLLERRGVKVEKLLRRMVGRLMAMLGVYAVEALDNVGERLREPGH
jgi:5S rRNA maturation endonuclease (ribonuclease M5)